jgi:trehalose 6-phosphate synthase
VGAATAGGLAAALAEALRAHEGLWFGWSGDTTETFTGEPQFDVVGGVTVATIDLEDQDLQEYYNGYANKTLWPLFHYRIDLTEYQRSFSKGYARVNKQFAESLRPLLRPDDLIWVHDYHLIPLGLELRRLGVQNRIGFFLHIPWPARELMATLPRARELVSTMFYYDLIGFHTTEWLEAFHAYVTKSGGRVGPDGSVSAFGRTARAGAFPIGIDGREYAELARSEGARESYGRMKESLNGRRMIVGVDRLDYSKGLEDRFGAYEIFLRDNPHLREEVFLLQIATKSREEVEAYQDIRDRLDALSGRINGEYATVDWVPLRYVNTSHRRDELAGIYRSAHVGLVTPLRDGMNLVAKEYVAAQDPEDPGVLILSAFAGAALQMREALIVNPFSHEDVAEAIKRALSMPLSERTARWQALLHGVVTEDVAGWRDNFVRALQAVQR